MHNAIRKIALLVFLFCACAQFSFAQDYTQYHLSINHTEEEIFVKGHVHQGLQGYVDVFKKYDFVFMGDCITAMQLALYDNNEQVFLIVVTKAFQNGLMPRHFELHAMRYVRNHPLYIKNVDKIQKLYEGNRAHYLKRIDTVTLKKMICLYAYDQLSKNPHPGESTPEYTLRYKPLITHTLSEVKKIIYQKGFPSDKMIGLDQDDIMRELHVDSFDAIDYYYRNKDDIRFYAAPTQFKFDEYCFSSGLYFPIIIHYISCLDDDGEHRYSRYDKRRYLIYSDEFFMQQIKAGNVHPKDVAFLYDQGFIGYPPKPGIHGEKFFNVGTNVEYMINQPGSISREELNKVRAEFFIAPIETDIAKYHFLKEHGMLAGSGYSGCRS